MKRVHVLLAILVVMAAVGYRPVLSLLRGGGAAGEVLTCEYDGRPYALEAQRRADDGCNICTCGATGWSCTKIACAAGEGLGSISGTLAFPSEVLPAQRVCAISLKDDKEYCQETTLGAASFAIPAPSGDYWVYASLEDDVTGKRAYWSEFVRCGLEAACKDHTPVTVTVKPGETAQADPQDWYAVGQFDLLDVTPSRYEYDTHNYYPTSSFLVKARGLSAVEIQSTPYPPQEGAPFSSVGEASLVSVTRDIQTWKLPIPQGFQAMQIRAKGTSENGDHLMSRTVRIVRPIETAAASSTVE